jgi:hypothetical protein
MKITSARLTASDGTLTTNRVFIYRLVEHFLIFRLWLLMLLRNHDPETDPPALHPLAHIQ